MYVVVIVFRVTASALKMGIDELARKMISKKASK